MRGNRQDIMVILQVTHRFLPRQVGGIETYTLHLSQELSKRHRVHVFACTHDPAKEQVPADDTEYEGLAVHRVHCICRTLQPQCLATFRNERLVSRFEGFVRGLRPDMVHIQHSDTLPIDLASVCRAQGIPAVLTLHDYTFSCPTEYLIDFDGKVCHRHPGSVCLKCVLPTPVPKLSKLVGKAAIHRLASLYYRLSDGTPDDGGSYTLGLIKAHRYRTETLNKELAKAEALIAPSQALGDRAVSVGFPPSKVWVVPNGIAIGDPPAHTQDVPGGTGADSLPTAENRDRRTIRFAFIGRVVPIKGVHVLIRAFQEVQNRGEEQTRPRADPGRPGAELLIYGPESPTYGPEIRRMAAGWEDIHFQGRLEPENLQSILAEIDVVVMPSVCVENMPLVALEGLSAKIPVIGSDVGGLAEIIRDSENGFLFPMGDVAALAHRMRTILEKPAILEGMRERIGPVMSIEENARRVEAIYEEVLENRA